ncbi:MAG: hypothetical protein MJ183_05205 [Treponemataceae bacterium]|nr:hypothetical protein [Treponemataceae bacterium]
MNKSLLAKRIFMSLFGVIICAVSVGLFKLAALGVDPFQSFMAGMDALIPISFGTLYTIVNIILLLFSLIFYRKNIGLATFINMFLLGYITQFSYEFFMKVFPEPSMVFRFASLIIAVVVMCFGSAFYMTADLGVSTYDAVAITMVEKWKMGKFKFIRIATDLVCVVLGCAIFLISGGTWGQIPTIAGIGTIITAFFMGPLIEFFNVTVARPMLNGKK